jgi:hypothetical protein
MKLMRYKKFLLTAFALANGFLAAAQPSGVPGPADYEKFSSFITQRNIFDPNRYPRQSSTRPSNYHPRVSRSAPTFTLVGTMSYEKGMFAFFDGNSSDLRKVLPESGGIAGYTVTEVTLAGVKLQSADKKETIQMKIGEMMRQEGSHWLPAGQGEMAPVAGDMENATPAATGSSGSDASSAPSSALEANDILKKLMQQKKQEEQGLK